MGAPAAGDHSEFAHAPVPPVLGGRGLRRCVAGEIVPRRPRWRARRSRSHVRGRTGAPRWFVSGRSSPHDDPRACANGSWLGVAKVITIASTRARASPIPPGALVVGRDQLVDRLGLERADPDECPRNAVRKGGRREGAGGRQRSVCHGSWGLSCPTLSWPRSNPDGSTRARPSPSARCERDHRREQPPRGPKTMPRTLSMLRAALRGLLPAALRGRRTMPR